jgi:hypothetical protein
MHSGIEVHIIRIHQHIEKNSVPLKEVLTDQCRHDDDTFHDDAWIRRRATRATREKPTLAIVAISERGCAAMASCISKIDDGRTANIAPSRHDDESRYSADSESQLLAIKIFLR